ncbi:agamous-like MADS-box protein AGL80 [Andrographis paniculata]|uniref:agamous-like MADS-box protein AGL80 n=1 Tax=Andrographis paniculata TaxID=175694 RepID=UPI0021E80B13|nr:agamous-like MADS-box protein AGL80 [Andrographis paniculata]
MAPKKSKYVEISSERVRNSTLKRRLDGLYKKAHELSVLCGVDIAVIIHDSGEGNTMLWPSPDKVINDVDKFLSLPDQERLKKMVLQENYLMDKVKDMTERVSELRQKNEETEMGFVLNQLINGKNLNELDTRQLNSVYQLVDKKLKNVQTRNEELEGVQDNTPAADIAGHCLPFLPGSEAAAARKSQDSCPPAATPITTFMQDMAVNGENMFGIQDNLNLWKGSDIEPEPTKAATPFNEGNQLDDFSQVWSSIFSP